MIERTWKASDFCENSIEKIQKITIKPITSDLNSDFTKMLMLAFNEISVADSVLMGQVGAHDKITLENTDVGNEDADDVSFFLFFF